jgi:uncharacterized heparinase superfamily protein
VTAPLATALRFWETVRWLKPAQIYGRFWFHLTRPNVDQSPAPPRRPQSAPWTASACRRPSLIGARRFRFLNVEADLDEIGWDGPNQEKLWRYNQHYFEDLTAIDAAQRRDWHHDLIDDWVQRHPPAHGTGWEPYPVSLRIVNWIKWALAGGTLTDRHTDSLAIQIRYLSKRLERHLLGNHLFVNAKALIFAGVFFEGPEAESWRRLGFDILKTEFDEQILPDGGQFELSPMYHALALEDVLDLVNIARTYQDALSSSERTQSAGWEEAVTGMRAWLAAMSHPDGDLSFFNDAAFGIAPHREELEAYAQRLGLENKDPLAPLTWLKESGYARLQSEDAVLLCDIGRIGPDYLPGHAHADTLSFEISLYGQRVFVNSGTSVYGTGEERLRQRGTPAHNTVTIAGRNSSDVWSGFRVGARARPIEARVFQDGQRLIAEGAHDGYRALPGRPVHRRIWTLRPDNLEVSDEVRPGAHLAEARFHLHPDVRVEQSAPGEGHLVLANGERARWRASGGPVRIEASTWHPEFGMSRPSACLVLPLENGSSQFELTWS